MPAFRSLRNTRRASPAHRIMKYYMTRIIGTWIIQPPARVKLRHPPSALIQQLLLSPMVYHLLPLLHAPRHLLRLTLPEPADNVRTQRPPLPQIRNRLPFQSQCHLPPVLSMVWLTRILMQKTKTKGSYLSLVLSRKVPHRLPGKAPSYEAALNVMLAVIISASLP